jgi:hypothetical protein
MERDEAATLAVLSSHRAQLAFWDAIKDSEDASEFEVYLERYSEAHSRHSRNRSSLRNRKSPATRRKPARRSFLSSLPFGRPRRTAPIPRSSKPISNATRRVSSRRSRNCGSEHCRRAPTATPSSPRRRSRSPSGRASKTARIRPCSKPISRNIRKAHSLRSLRSCWMNPIGINSRRRTESFPAERVKRDQSQASVGASPCRRYCVDLFGR